MTRHREPATGRTIHDHGAVMRSASVPRLTAALGLALLAAAAAFAAEPIATVASNVQGIEIDLMSVERKGNVLTVKWAARNTGEERVEVRFGLTGEQATSYIVDEENGAKYYALTDQEGNVLAAEHAYVDTNMYGISERVEAGSTKRFWAKFPAPPPEVQVVSIFFTETEPLEGVTITER